MVGENDIFEKRKSSWEISRATKKAETKLGDFPGAVQMAAPLPEANASQPLNDLSPNQTRSQPLLNSIIYEAKKSIYKYNDVDIAWSGVLTKQAKKSPWPKSRAVKHWGRIVQSQFQFFRNQSFRDSTATRRVNDSTWFSYQCWITF